MSEVINPHQRMREAKIMRNRGNGIQDASNEIGKKNMEVDIIGPLVPYHIPWLFLQGA